MDSVVSCGMDSAMHHALPIGARWMIVCVADCCRRLLAVSRSCFRRTPLQFAVVRSRSAWEGTFL